MATRSVLAVLVVASVGCGSSGSAGDVGTSGDALTGTSCEPSDQALFFHGMNGFGRELATPGLCLPRLSSFWNDTAFIDASGASVVGGYSAGRLPLLRRLAAGAATESTAIMLDPSYSDGARFEGVTGPTVVTRWLEGDAARRFVFVYSPASAGWREYVALMEGPLAAQIRTCPVRGAHGDLPRIVTERLFLDVDAWLAERCADSSPR